MGSVGAMLRLTRAVVLVGCLVMKVVEYISPVVTFEVPDGTPSYNRVLTIIVNNIMISFINASRTCPIYPIATSLLSAFERTAVDAGASLLGHGGILAD